MVLAGLKHAFPRHVVPRVVAVVGNVQGKLQIHAAVRISWTGFATVDDIGFPLIKSLSTWQVGETLVGSRGDSLYGIGAREHHHIAIISDVATGFAWSFGRRTERRASLFTRQSKGVEDLAASILADVKHGVYSSTSPNFGMRLLVGGGMVPRTNPALDTLLCPVGVLAAVVVRNQ
ncbi:Aste57867_5383 [Aphanomyces stellatus]|uniref:Aste57867_5383 protein n=1 Tax=Aphanomyces stellatus TaxID=120398 RepID=A0A485KE57_9STRA|nr:hypothetical protein As57867_005370 [Aphanomyces stellatus]VFT82441.1 Aste57867_5383 [Aphanomyces stellatus]